MLTSVVKEGLVRVAVVRVPVLRVAVVVAHVGEGQETDKVRLSLS